MKLVALVFIILLISGCGNTINNPDEVIKNIQKCQSIGAKTILYSQVEQNPMKITCSGLEK